MNFSINPNFNLNSFDNSITEFNKALSEVKGQSDKNLSSIQSFDEILNGVVNKIDTNQNQIQPFVGMDSINAQKVENYNISPTAKMANDIGNSLSDGLKSLNAVDKKAQDDFETFAAGGDISVHDVMISAEKSQLAMQMAIQLRNQVVNAYQEFKNMSI